MNKKLKLLFASLLFGSVGLLSAQTANIRFVNTGTMNVEGFMYVQGDIQMVNNPTAASSTVEVFHNGTTYLEGSFFHDAGNNVFVLENTDWSDKTKPRGVTSSAGTINFTGNSAGGKRYITATDTLSFDRVRNYIAFPKLEISTNDIIYVPSTMGIDARTIERTSGSDGVLYLASNLVSSKNAVYDASLRVTGDAGVFMVSPDAVVVEKWVKDFRATGSSGTEATMLMPFAPPFSGMRAGYFAGNWIRRPLMNDANSFFYPYANETRSGSTLIDPVQYIYKPNDILVPATAHLIRLQIRGGHYNGLYVTADEAYEKDKFIFNGTPYPSLGFHSDGVLFAGSPILDQTVRTGLPLTQNWIVGNSYTSGVSGQAIADYLMTGLPPNVYFAPSIYIYHHGATAYQTYPIWDYGTSRVPQDIPDIHSMSVFMVAAWQNNTNQAPIVIGPEYQVHTGGISAVNGTAFNPPNPLRSSRMPQGNTLNFVLSPENNPFVFSRSSVKLNEQADVNADSYDVSILPNGSNRLFHLYGTNLSRTRLQQNVLPYTAPLAMLSVAPAEDEMRVVLTVEDAGNFATEAVQLYDKKTGEWQDLRLNSSYSFVMYPGDDANRFEIHFKPMMTTGINNNSVSEWQAYAYGGELIITDLSTSLLYEPAHIHSAAGVLHIHQAISNVPEHRINISSLPTGVYLLSIQGRTVKFIK